MTGDSQEQQSTNDSRGECQYWQRCCTAQQAVTVFSMQADNKNVGGLWRGVNINNMMVQHSKRQ